MELNREQIVKAVAELRKRGLSNGGSIGYHAGWCDEVADLLENALALIRELTEEEEKLGIKNFDLICELSRIKEETVRKMQERLKESLVGFSDVFRYWAEGYIAKIAKELLEEQE